VREWISYYYADNDYRKYQKNLNLNFEKRGKMKNNQIMIYRNIEEKRLSHSESLHVQMSPNKYTVKFLKSLNNTKVYLWKNKIYLWNNKNIKL